MKPLPRADSGWGGALERFYEGQADVYDATRQGLLKGRTTMMKLATAHLHAGLKPHEKGNLVWVDVINLGCQADNRLEEGPVGMWKG